MRAETELSFIAPAQIERQPRVAEGAPAAHGSFAETLGQAVSKLDELQVGADVQAQKVSAGQGNLHEMALALEKADIAMRLALKVRNKVVDAYNEIMRMSL